MIFDPHFPTELLLNPVMSVCILRRESVRSGVLLRHVQPAVAEPASGLRIQAPVDSDEPRRRGPDHGLSPGHTAGQCEHEL